MELPQKGNCLYDLINFSCLIDFFQITVTNLELIENIKSLLINSLSIIPITSYSNKESAQTLYYINYINKQSSFFNMNSPCNFKLLFYIALSPSSDISKSITKYNNDKQTNQDKTLSELTRLIIISQHAYDNMLLNLKQNNSYTIPSNEYGVIYSPPNMLLLKDILIATLTEMITRQFYFISNKPPLIQNNNFTIHKYKDIIKRIQELIQLHSYDIAINALKLLYEIVEPELEKVKLKEYIALCYFYQDVFYKKMEFSKEIENLFKTAIMGYKKLKENYLQCESLIKLSTYYAYFENRFKDQFINTINNIYECINLLKSNQQIRILLKVGWLFQEKKLKRKYLLNLYMCFNICKYNIEEYNNVIMLIVKELGKEMNIANLEYMFNNVKEFENLHCKVYLSTWKYNKVLLYEDNMKEYFKKKFEKGMLVIIKKYIDEKLNMFILQPKWFLIQKCIFINIIEYLSSINDIKSHLMNILCYLQTLNDFLNDNEQKHIMNTFIKSSILFHNKINISISKIPILYKLLPKTSFTIFDIDKNPHYKSTTDTSQQLFLYNPWEKNNMINYFYTKNSIQNAEVTLKNILKCEIILNQMCLFISYENTQNDIYVNVYPSIIIIPPLSEIKLNLRFKLLKEGEFNIEGIQYEIGNVRTVQFVDYNGNGLYYGNNNEYCNPLMLRKMNSRKKKMLYNLRNIKIYPEIPLIDVYLINNNEHTINGKNEFILYDNQSLEFEFMLTNIGEFMINYIKVNVYAYKKEDYKISLKESQLQIENICIKPKENKNIKINYLHKKSYLKIEFRFYYKSNDHESINTKEEFILHPFVQIIKEVRTEQMFSYDNFKLIPKITHNNQINIIKCDNKRIDINNIKEYIYCIDTYILNFTINNTSQDELNVTLSYKKSQTIQHEIIENNTSKQISFEIKSINNVMNTFLLWEYSTSNGLIHLKDIIPNNITFPNTNKSPITFSITCSLLTNEDNVEYNLITYSCCNNNINELHNYLLLIYLYMDYNGNICINDELKGKMFYYEGNLSFKSRCALKSGDMITKQVKIFKLYNELGSSDVINTTCMLFDTNNNILYLNPMNISI